MICSECCDLRTNTFITCLIQGAHTSSFGIQVEVTKSAYLSHCFLEGAERLSRFQFILCPRFIVCFLSEIDGGDETDGGVDI